MVVSFFNRGYLLKEVNKTNIVLMPKHPRNDNIKDFCPISLCNVAYSIISMVLANRMQPMMNHLISPFQNAFVKGRVISNNIILTGEVLHHIKK